VTWIYFDEHPDMVVITVRDMVGSGIVRSVEVVFSRKDLTNMDAVMVCERLCDKFSEAAHQLRNLEGE
jgi:hypothetical protein